MNQWKWNYLFHDSMKDHFCTDTIQCWSKTTHNPSGYLLMKRGMGIQLAVWTGRFHKYNTKSYLIRKRTKQE